MERKSRCTDYVAWRLSVAGINVDYGRFPGQWNANQWAANARALGYTVDHNPVPGATAVWTGGPFGHVAVTSAVNAGGITVQDYKWAWDQAYHVHTASGASWYIHFGDAQVAGLKPAGTGPTPTPPSAPGPVDLTFHFNGHTRLVSVPAVPAP